MNIDEIRSLVEIIKDNDLTEFELDEGDFSIRIRRGTEPQYISSPQPVVYQQPSAPSQPAQTGPAASVESVPVEDSGLETITSPMVGTFYRSPSPESPPFVTEGQSISKDSVVCILEAMKVMNEIQSEIGGTIVEILLQDGDAVEFGQPMFKVKP